MTIKRPYAPQPGSLADRVCTWFRRNPDEELSAADIAQQYDVSSSAVAASLAACYEHGLLRRDRSSGSVVTVAGPNLKARELPAAVTLLTAPPTKRQTSRATRTSLPELDWNLVQVAEDMPVPPKRLCVRGATKYARLFELLSRPGLSAPIPLAYVAAVQKAAIVRSKGGLGKYVVRRTGENEARIWRTE